MAIFDYTNYKSFVVDKIKAMPGGGRGEFQRIAEALSMHTTSVSQVFRRPDKDLTLEQAARFCGHWGLIELEADYFANLVELNRAGNDELRSLVRRRLRKLHEQSRALVHRLPVDHTLTESEKSRYYSNWYYGAIHMLCDIPEYRSPNRIAERTGLPLKRVNEALQFLQSCGLLMEEKGELKTGPKRIFLENSSPLVSRHHANWRQKAIERLDRIENHRDFVLTVPMTLAKEDAVAFRATLVEFAESLIKVNETSASEEFYFLNIDWLKF